MARGKTRDSQLLRPAVFTGRAMKGALEVRERVDVWLTPFATGVGWLGMVALLGCAVLHWVPREQYPWTLERRQLPTYVVMSLIAASLLGWSRMQHGMQILRKKVGKRWGTTCFVLLPVLCLALVQLDFHGLIDVRGWAQGRRIHPLLLWYPTVVVLACLVAQVRAHSRTHGRTRRWRLLAVLLQITPYAVMLAFFVFQVPVPLVDHGVHKILRDAGAAAILVQLLLAFFVVA